MSEPDFTGIDPLRVPEARRRVAAIEEYLRLSTPTSADTQRFAKIIGLSRVQFSRLARVWRDHRDARLLVIGKRGASTRKYNVDDRAIAIAHKVIEAAGARVKLANVAPEIEKLCVEAGVAPPSRSTINNYIRAARGGSAAPAEGPPRIVVGRMWFHLPIADRPADAMPTVLAAVMLPERIVIAHIISVDPDAPPSAAALIDAVAAQTSDGADARPLLLDPDDRRMAAAALDRAGIGRTRSHDRSVQSELSSAFRGTLGFLAAIHRRGSARPGTKRVATRQDAALPDAEVMTVIEDAITSHNAAVSTAMPEFTLAPR